MVFIEFLEFRCIWNYFMNSVIVKFSVLDDNSISFIGFHLNNIIYFFYSFVRQIVDVVTWRSFVVAEITIGKIWEMHFIWFLVFSDFRLLIKEQWLFSKVVKISDFRILSGWIEKYKSASSWDNPCCMSLVILLLVVNVGRMQFPISDDNFSWCVCSDFWRDFLWDILDCFMVQKSIVDSCF